MSTIRNIRIKVALTATLLFLVVLALIAALQVCQLRAAAKHILSDQQFQLATRVANEVAGRLASRRAILEQEAGAFSSALDGNALHTRFDHDNALHILFDRLTVVSAQGRAVYAWPTTPGIAAPAFIKEVFAQHAPVISAPYAEGAQKQPHVAIAVPIIDNKANGKGTITGVLVGSINLLGDNFLGDLADARIGRNGYFYVVTTGDAPVFVIHKNTERILTALPDKGVNPSLDRALQGFEGTLEGANSVGIKGLFTFKQIADPHWIVATVLPGDEVYGAVGAAVKTALLLILLIAILGIAGIWALSYWLLKSES